MFERVLIPNVMQQSPLLDELRPIARRALSRRVHQSYRAAAEAQLRLLSHEPTAKKLLNVLRPLLTGAHLLATGELELDVTRLMPWRNGEGVAPSVERKPGVAAIVDAWRPRVDALFDALDAAREGSALPDEPPNEVEVREWLMGVRQARG
jgi:hypothetical protein